MRAPILIVVLAIPLLELALLIKLGGAIGFWRTIAIIAGTAIAGILVLRSQGLASLRQANEAMRADRPPVEPVMDGALRILGGILLITPGVLADLAGGMLLIPPVRRLIMRRMLARAEASGSVRVKVFRTGARASASEPADEAPPRRSRGPAAGPVIEGEFERIEEKPSEPGRQPPRPRGET